MFVKISIYFEDENKDKDYYTCNLCGGVVSPFDVKSMPDFYKIVDNDF